MAGEITGARVEMYIYDLLPERDEVLREIEAQAQQRSVPIVGPAVGRLLFQMTRLIGAKHVFEMGSAIGYSTIWLARGVGEGGSVVYTDGDPKNAAEAKGYFDKAGVAEIVQVKTGDALELLSEEKRQFDLIFNDVDKEDYPRVLRLVSSKLRKGGLFITDNVLWGGRVADRESTDEATRAIQEFNRRLYGSEEFFTCIVPLRDGVAVAMKA